jgi:hypothetical protein
MPKFNGQTDSPLKIKLASAILEARWGLAQVANGGIIPIEVVTAFVADGSDITITLKDMDGKTIDTLKGKVFTNLYRANYTLAKPNKTGGMVFEAELPAHKLKKAVGKIPIPYPVKITELKMVDSKGKEIKELGREEKVGIQAKIDGPPPETPCVISIGFQSGPTGTTILYSTSAKLKSGKVSCTWKRAAVDERFVKVQSELDKTGEKYFVPRFTFEVNCLGTIASSFVEYHSWAEFDFGKMHGQATFKFPDGTEKTETIPANGLVKLEKPKAGRIIIKELQIQ